jgi:hypothetical protein
MKHTTTNTGSTHPPASAGYVHHCASSTIDPIFEAHFKLCLCLLVPGYRTAAPALPRTGKSTIGRVTNKLCDLPRCASCVQRYCISPVTPDQVWSLLCSYSGYYMQYGLDYLLLGRRQHYSAISCPIRHLVSYKTCFMQCYTAFVRYILCGELEREPEMVWLTKI